MSLALSPLSAAPSVQPSARPAERGSDPETPMGGSFGEVLSRASQSADEPAAKPQDKDKDKATATRTARRPGGPRDDTAEPTEPTAVSGLVLMALDGRSTPPVLGSAAGAALGSAAAAALGGEARRPAAAGPLTQALVGASLPAKDAAPLPDAVTDVTVPAEPAMLMALAAPGASERGQPLLTTRKDGTLPAAASDNAPTAVPRTALDGTSTPPALGSAAAAALGGEARQPVAADPLAQALVSASLPAKDAAPLPDAAAVVTVPAEPAMLMALAAPGAKERGQPLMNTRKDTSLPVAASDSAPTAAPRMALDAPTTESPALRSPERPAAGAPGQKATPGTISVLPAPVHSVGGPAGSVMQPQLEALIASISASGFAEPASGAQASSVAGPAMMGSAAQGPANIGGPALAPAVLSPALPQDVGSSEWGKALGEQLLHMGRVGQETAELQLNPPGLGPLKVTLSMNEHQIQAAFVSTHASVRAAVEAALPQLRAAMADSGISLGQASVGSESRQPADAGHGQEGRPGQRSYPGKSAGELAGGPERAGTEPRRHGNGTSVDIYA